MADEARQEQDRFLNKLQSDGQQRPDATREEAFETFGAMGEGVDSPALGRLRTAVAGLSEEARRELVALMMVGRGEFAADEWEAAMARAAAMPGDTQMERLTDKAQLREFLKKGLYELRLG